MAGARSVVPILALLGAACGGGGGGAPAAARAPTRAGDVWEIDHPDDRANAAGAALAYVNGLHVMVVDGNRAWAGMTRLDAESGADGARTFHLDGGLTADLVKAGDGLELRFSTGERVPLRKREGSAQ